MGNLTDKQIVFILMGVSYALGVLVGVLRATRDAADAQVSDPQPQWWRIAILKATERKQK